MDYPELVEKKSLKVRIQELITQFFSLFIKKERVLNAAPEELTQELKEINETYNTLTNEDSFSKIKDTYDLYKVGVSPEGGLIAIEKDTGYVKDDPKFVSRVRFASLWRKSAFGDFDIKDEENCYKECFSDESENERLIRTGKIAYSFENTMYGTLGPERMVWDEETWEAMDQSVKKQKKKKGS